MSFPSLPKEKLVCPRCGGTVTTIHPYYSAAEKSFDLQFFHQWWLYPLAGLFSIIWWPLGVVATLLVFQRDLRKAKQERLYRCNACDAQLSYEEATPVEKRAT